MKYVVLIIALVIIGCSSELDKLQSLSIEPFTKEKWKSASQEERGKMLYSFLKTHEIRNMHRKEIIGLLGEPTGYYDYEYIPAYFIGPDSVSSSYGKGYLLIFPNDESTGRVEGYEIIPRL